VKDANDLVDRMPYRHDHLFHLVGYKPSRETLSMERRNFHRTVHKHPAFQAAMEERRLEGVEAR